MDCPSSGKWVQLSGPTQLVRCPACGRPFTLKGHWLERSKKWANFFPEHQGQKAPRRTPAAKRKVVAKKKKTAKQPFWAQVLEAARSPTKGFSHKAWISAVWRKKFRHMDINEFKRQLVDAAVAGNIRLSRMDLTAAVDSVDLQESVIYVGRVMFHLIDRPADDPAWRLR